MRIFIGIELDDTVRRSAAAIATAVADHLGRRVTARWIPALNLHLTLWFLGQVIEERADEILRATDRPFKTESFELQIGGVGAFPTSGPPRVIWLGVQRGAPSLNRLHAELATRLVPIGIEPDSRPFSAHLTIARVSASERRDAGGLRASLGAMPADAGTCRIEMVTVFQSHLSPKGATYEPLLRVPLV